jgi:hypothetical protein
MDLDHRAFYVCVYLKNGKPVGHRASLNADFPVDISEKQKKPAPAENLSNFSKASQDYLNVMVGYFEYVPIILELTPTISHHMVTQALQAFLEKQSVSCNREADRLIYRFKMEQFPSFCRFDDSLSAAAATSRAFPRMLTVGLVASLEFHLARLMVEIAKCFPEEIFESNRTVSLLEIINYSSLEEFKNKQIDKEIDQVQRENLETQVKWITSKCKLDDLSKHYSEWPHLIELFERRNLFVHTNGTVSNQYIKAAQHYNFPSRELLKLGAELHANPDYYKAAVQRVMHFGSILTQLVWRKCYPDESVQSDKSISGLGFELLVSGHYELAIKILESAQTIRGMSDAYTRRNVVNLAIAYKLLGEKEKSLEVLNSKDWTAAAPAFLIGIAGVKDEVEAVVAWMKKLGKESDYPGPQDYQEWPAFYGIRGDEKFKATFTEVFGFDYIPSSKMQAGIAQVLHWIEANSESPADAGPLVTEEENSPLDQTLTNGSPEPIGNEEPQAPHK